MKLKHYFVMLLMVLVGNTGANPGLLRGAGEILKTPSATQALSRLFGVSQTRLATMSPEARGRLLESRLNTLKEQGEQGLVTDINRFFSNISQDGLGMERAVEGLIARMPREKVSVRKFLNTPSKRANVLDILRSRVQKGELASIAVDEFSATVQSANKALGFDILGKSAGNCLKKFSPTLVGNFMTLVSSLQNPGALTSVESAFNAMVSNVLKNFLERMSSMQRSRICGLAGQSSRYRCRALAPQMCAL